MLVIAVYKYLILSVGDRRNWSAKPNSSSTGKKSEQRRGKRDSRTLHMCISCSMERWVWNWMNWDYVLQMFNDSQPTLWLSISMLALSLIQTRAPSKKKLFMWLAEKGSCLITDNFSKHGRPKQQTCKLCLTEDKDCNHLFVRCNYSKSLWQMIGDG